MLSLFLKIIASLGAILLIGFMLNDSLNETEKIECHKWNKEAREYPAYYFTDWQVGQCNAHGIELQLPVKIVN